MACRTIWLLVTYTTLFRMAHVLFEVLPDGFWDRVRLHRKALGLTLDELSLETGVSKKALIRLEKGEDVRISTLLKVFARLRLSLDFAPQVHVLTPLAKNLKVKPLSEDEQNGWF